MGTFKHLGLVGLVLWAVACGGGAPEAGEAPSSTEARLEALSAQTGMSRAQLLATTLQRAREHQACSGGMSFLDGVSEDGTQSVRTVLPPPEGAAFQQAVSAFAPAPSWCVPGSSCPYCGGSCTFGGRVLKSGTKSWSGTACYCNATVYPWDYWNSCGC
jgi:hypothetical protein